MSSVVRVVSIVIAIAFGLSGAACGGDPPDDPRERAIALSRQAFETAERQQVDMKRTPCIYNPSTPDGSDPWFTIVVFPGDGSPRDAAIAAGCPGAQRLGYVALNPSGEVIEVRGIAPG
jgi:hypothetical protein